MGKLTNAKRTFCVIVLASYQLRICTKVN